MSRGDLARMRSFYEFGVIASGVTLLACARFGGDPLLQQAFWWGLSVIVLCFFTSFLLVTRVERYRPTPIAVLWLVANVAFLPALAYFGPFSLGGMVDVLAIMFISLGELRRTAYATAAIGIGGHFVVALPILVGWVPDHGIVAHPGTPEQQWLAEGYSLGFMIAGFLLARWARVTQVQALDEIRRARAASAGGPQPLASDRHGAHDTNPTDEGWWTHHTMGSFTLGLVLGRSATSEIYEALGSDGTLAAVKLLNIRSSDRSALVEHVHRELAVAAQLRSPHLVQIYELSPPGEPVPYVAMERLDGIDLASRLRLRLEGQLPPDELVGMLDQVARGLEVARHAGLVHRELTPHNLFCHAATTWKILNLGMSRRAGRASALTGDSITATTPYLAPEQVLGGDVTHRADVYALGAVAYRCLTGRALFDDRAPAEQIDQIAHAPPVRPSTLCQVSHAIDGVLALALAKDPRRRFPSALAFSQAFLAARHGRRVPIEPPPDAWRDWRPALALAPVVPRDRKIGSV